MSGCTKAESLATDRFDEVYKRSVTPVMQAIERQVCGCDYGGNSWTTRQQAGTLVGLLGLDDGSDFLELGAGTGWPGIFLAKESGCNVSLVDLPEVGLKIAEKRAQEEGLAHLVSTKSADAADLPYAANRFDAISHSDLLCCLVRKRDVLEQCKRVIRPQGKMVFTVISITPGLSETQYTRAVANAPEFTETETDYPSLIEQTGWLMADRTDLTGEYAESCARQIEADTDHRDELEALLGSQQAKERIASWQSKHSAICDGLFRRELFVCRPDQNSD